MRSWHLHAAHMILIQQSWYQFCADFPHAQIFGDNLPNMSDSFAIIRTVNQWSPHTVCLTSSTMTSVLLIEDLQLLESFFTSLLLSNLLIPCCACIFLSPYIWSISSTCDRVPQQPDLKFQMKPFSWCSCTTE